MVADDIREGAARASHHAQIKAWERQNEADLATIRQRNDEIAAMKAQIEADARIRLEAESLWRDEKAAIQTSLRETQASRALAEERAVALQRDVDVERAKVAERDAEIGAWMKRSTKDAVSYGRLRGILYIITRLVLSNDVDTAKAVARGVKDEVGS